jgi:hypothetical protein
MFLAPQNARCGLQEQVVWGNWTASATNHYIGYLYHLLSIPGRYLGKVKKIHVRGFLT